MSGDAENMALRLAALERECTELRARERANQELAETAARRLAFLSESSALLARSLDYETTLATVARLTVPFLGDSCVLHLIDPDGSIRYVEQVHVVPAKEELVRRLRRRHPLTWDTDHPLVDVLRSGQPYITGAATERIRGHVSNDPDGLAMIDALGYRSVLIVPLVIRGEILGALSLIVSESERRYDAVDVAFAEELASRAAQAIDNARIYREAQEAIHRKDELLDELRRMQQQLLHAQRLESVGRLAAGVAHDFNNLLTVIGGYADLVAAEPDLSEVQRGGLQQIVQAVDRAAVLTRQLLAFARKQPFDPQPIDPGRLLKEMQLLLPRLLGEKIALAMPGTPELWTIHADPRQIEQVLLNLAANARDAMRDSGTLTLRAQNLHLGVTYTDSHVSVPPGDYLQLHVQDTGEGIPPELQTKVFEPFFTTKDQGKGTGLGLAMCYGIVQQHGGYITLESAAGQGTTFAIYLPRAQGKPQEPTTLETPTSATGGEEVVLVVEDEPGVRELVAHLLRERGYTVLLAENGVAALQLLDHYHGPPIRLLVSDVRMPQMGGPQLARQLQARGLLPKVLFISGYTDSQLSEEDLRDSGSTLIYKPFAAEYLVRVVRRLLDGGPVGT